MTFENHVAPRAAKDSQEIRRFGHTRLAIENRVTMARDAAIVLGASYGYRSFPSELATKDEIVLRDPKKLRLPQFGTPCGRFVKHPATSVEKPDRHVQTTILTVDGTRHRIGRPRQTNTTDACRGQDPLCQCGSLLSDQADQALLGANVPVNEGIKSIEELDNRSLLDLRRDWHRSTQKVLVRQL
jgi:hypothetical protein